MIFFTKAPREDKYSMTKKLEELFNMDEAKPSTEVKTVEEPVATKY